jgi:hypothetical protein
MWIFRGIFGATPSDEMRARSIRSEAARATPKRIALILFFGLFESLLSWRGAKSVAITAANLNRS